MYKNKSERKYTAKPIYMQVHEVGIYMMCENYWRKIFTKNYQFEIMEMKQKIPFGMFKNKYS